MTCDPKTELELAVRRHRLREANDRLRVWLVIGALVALFWLGVVISLVA